MRFTARQKCPVCASNRIRRGYRHTPFWKKLFFRYYLLCDGCNLEFIGFALPPSWESKKSRRQSKEKRKTGSIPLSSVKADQTKIQHPLINPK
jgi:hypothetical protein